MNEPVSIAILAKAPVPGLAKTRLIPLLGSERAAQLQGRLIERAVECACLSAVGEVTLWTTPDDRDPLFQAVRARGLSVHCQSKGDLGSRMLEAIEAVNGPALVIGTDCPGLTADHLREAADTLRRGTEVVIFPAEDGGYVLIGMRAPHPALFEPPFCWGSAGVLGETRRRLKCIGLAWQEPRMFWDIDLPADIERLRATCLRDLLPQAQS
jgi:rSAM/selenodomain-associated transferase 1